MKKNSGIAFLIVGVLLVLCAFYGIATSLAAPIHIYNLDPDELETERKTSMLFVIGCLVSFIVGIIVTAVGFGRMRKAKRQN